MQAGRRKTHKLQEWISFEGQNIKVFSEIQSGSDIQGVTKMLGHASKVNLLPQNKKKSLQTYAWKLVILEFDRNITFINKYVN